MDKIKERSAIVTWNMDDVGEEYAKVTYYMVLYGTGNITLDEKVLGIAILIFCKKDCKLFSKENLPLL